MASRRSMVLTRHDSRVQPAKCGITTSRASSASTSSSDSATRRAIQLATVALLPHPGGPHSTSGAALSCSSDLRQCASMALRGWSAAAVAGHTSPRGMRFTHLITLVSTKVQWDDGSSERAKVTCALGSRPSSAPADSAWPASGPPPSIFASLAAASARARARSLRRAGAWSRAKANGFVLSRAAPRSHALCA